jgi:hypothetical protein
MALAAQLSEHVLDEVTAAIGPYLATVFPDRDRSTAELGESFDLWRFSGIVRSANESFMAHMTQTGEHYHQIFMNGEARGFAHSRPNADGGLLLTRMAPSQLARWIDEAIADVESVFPEEVVVHLVKASSYRLTAFWIPQTAKANLYVLSCPTFFKFVPRRTFIFPDAFMSALASEQRTMDSRRSRER